MTEDYFKSYAAELDHYFGNMFVPTTFEMIKRDKQKVD